MRKMGSVGNAFFDFYGTDVPLSGDVSIGTESVSIELNSAEECGVDGCEGLTLTSGAVRVYAVPRAISYKGSGVPADCPQYPINARQGAPRAAGRHTHPGRRPSPKKKDTVGAGTPAPEKKTQTPGQTPTVKQPAQAAEVHTAAINNNMPTTVCVGPSYVVSLTCWQLRGHLAHTMPCTTQP
jgi:hypothetical protein